MSAAWPRVTGTWMQQVWPAVAAFLLLQVVFFLLVLGAMAVPNRPIARHLQQSIASKNFAVDERVKQPLGLGTSDTFTECITLTMGLARVQHSGLIYRTVADGHFGACGSTRKALAKYDGTQPALQEYFRYWHGYTVLTRPFLAIAGVKALRVALWTLLAAAFGLCLWSCGRWWWLAGATLLPFVLTTDAIVLPLAVQDAIAWIAVLLGWTIVWRRGRWSVAIAATLAGSLFAFVDFLTNPPAAWTLVTFAAGASTYVASHRLRAAARDAGIGAAMWFIGFAATWGSKWLLGLDVYGWRRFRTEVIDQVGLRASSTGVDKRWGITTRYNFDTWLSSGVHEVLVIAVLVGVVAALSWAGWHQRLRVALVLAAPAVIAPIWYEILKNHSQIHAFFTYRSLSVACGVAIAAALLATSRAHVERDVVGMHRADGRVVQ